MRPSDGWRHSQHYPILLTCSLHRRSTGIEVGGFLRGLPRLQCGLCLGCRDAVNRDLRCAASETCGPCTGSLARKLFFGFSDALVLRCQRKERAAPFLSLEMGIKIGLLLETMSKK